MTSPIRVLHFADSHIGMENYGKTDPSSGLSSRVVDFLRRMDEIVEYAREHQVDLTIFAGDAFKTRNPNPTFQREFAHRVRDLSLLAPIVLLVGNHDLPPSTLKASSIEIYDTLKVHNVWVAYDYEGRVIETNSGPVYVGVAPYPIRSRILEKLSTAGLTIAQTDELLQAELTRILEALAAEANHHAMPRLLTGHFTVGGAVVGSERGIMLGRDVSVSKTSIADDRWDYVALGHIHKHQNLTAGRIDAPPVVYSGSIERIDFGEEGDPKGFCWVDLQRDETEWRFVELNARPFVTLKTDLRRSHNPTQDALLLIDKHGLRHAVVRMIAQFTPESEARFNELAIRNAIQQAGAFHFAGLKKEVEQPVRARLGASPEGLTPPELLERYLISKQIDESRRAELLESADSIFNTENPER